MAIASLVLGILWLGGLGSLLAVIFGHTALRQIRTSGEGGRGLGIAGLVLGYVGVATTAALLIAGIGLGSSDPDDGGGRSVGTRDNTTMPFPSTTRRATTTERPTTTAPKAGSSVITIPPAGAAITGATPCPATDGSSPRTTSFAEAPPMCIDPAHRFTATIETTEGDMTVELDAASAPLAVNNFIVLARYHAYDGVAFHRIITGFVNQGGDFTGPSPGTGGPGYRFADELPKSAAVYREGALAMANSGADTNGSQFFFVVGQGGSQLQPNYTKFGQVTDGLEVMRTINGFATTNIGRDATTSHVVTITSVAIAEG